MTSMSNQKLDARQAIMEYMRSLLETRDKDALLNSALGLANRLSKKMTLSELNEWSETLRELWEKENAKESA